MEQYLITQSLLSSWGYTVYTETDNPGHQQPAPTEQPCPITAEEIAMLAKTLGKEAAVVSWNGTRWGMTPRARQAAVAWIAYNRLETGEWGDTLAEVLSYPNAFAYDPDAPVYASMQTLAEDVTARWWRERQGATDVGRVIPSDYLFFSGDGRENYFRKQFTDTGEYWNWVLADPYGGYNE